ncbi:MAG: S41 family peptidase [Pirellulales bacterium]
MRRRATACCILALLVCALASRQINRPAISQATAKDREQATSEKSLKGQPEGEEDYYELLEMFVDALDQVERNYIKDLSRRELMEAAIEGMLSKLDQHTGYVPPEELDRFRTGVENEFGGIGIRVSVERGRLRVVSPLVGTPAYRAGVLAGDIVTHIEGEPAVDIKVDEAVKRLKGPVGSEVTLTVQSPDHPEGRQITMKREIVRIQTVLGLHRLDDDSWEFLYDQESHIGYVRVTAFGRHTSRELRQALESLVSQNMKGLVLDLRFNPGGLLSSAVEVSDLFLSEGRIVSTRGRNVDEQVWDAHRRGTFADFPMVVLANQFSASAAEIVSACLQDHGRAVVVGQRTFGKGSVQNIIELENGRSALKLTTAGYLRPNGKNIDRESSEPGSDEWGVSPNKGFEIYLSDLEASRLANRRFQLDIIRKPREGDEANDDLPDQQLQKAVAYLQDQIKAASEKKKVSGTFFRPASADLKILVRLWSWETFGLAFRRGRRPAPSAI